MKPKGLSEREAWLVLAKDASLLSRYRVTDQYRAMGERQARGLTYNGLCGAIRLMGGLTATVEHRMMVAIRRERAKRRNRPAFLWPLTQSGFRRRVTFCRKQAARLRLRALFTVAERRANQRLRRAR